MSKYYISKGLLKQGPFTINQLTKFKIYADTPIWKEGTNNWVSASDLEELKDIVIVKIIIPARIKPLDLYFDRFSIKKIGYAFLTSLFLYILLSFPVGIDYINFKIENKEALESYIYNEDTDTTKLNSFDKESLSIYERKKKEEYWLASKIIRTFNRNYYEYNSFDRYNIMYPNTYKLEETIDIKLTLNNVFEITFLKESLIMSIFIFTILAFTLHLPFKEIFRYIEDVIKLIK